MLLEFSIVIELMVKFKNFKKREKRNKIENMPKILIEILKFDKEIIII